MFFTILHPGNTGRFFTPFCLNHLRISIKVAGTTFAFFTSPPLVAPARPVPFKARATLPDRRVSFTLTIEQRQTSIANVYSITYNTLVWIFRGWVWEQKRAQEREQTFQPPAQGLMNPSKPSAFSSYVSHVVFLCFVFRMQRWCKPNAEPNRRSNECKAGLAQALPSEEEENEVSLVRALLRRSPSSQRSCKITTFHIRPFVHSHLFFNHFNKKLH